MTIIANAQAPWRGMIMIMIVGFKDKDQKQCVAAKFKNNKDLSKQISKATTHFRSLNDDFATNSFDEGEERTVISLLSPKYRFSLSSSFCTFCSRVVVIMLSPSSRFFNLVIYIL